MNIALLIALLSLCIWLYLLLFRGQFWRVTTPLDAQNVPSRHTKHPSVTVIIPARNEADMLPLSLPGLLTQHYDGALHIILVDDRSDDNTAAVAHDIAAQHEASERVTILAGRPAPSGWKGKINAMQTGLDAIALQQHAPDYILFTDADIAYDSDMLARLVDRAESGNYVLTTLMVKLRCLSLFEQFLIPAFVYFFKMLYPFAWVNRKTHALAAAAGGVMLIRTETLLQAGMLTPIAHALIDDCALGRLMKKHGAIFLALTDKVKSIRPYPHMNDLRAMIARTAYDQLHYNPLLLLGTCVGLLLIFIAPVILMFHPAAATSTIAFITTLLMGLSFLPMSRFYQRPALSVFLLPLIAIYYLVFTLDSALQYYRGRGGMWKGRAQATGIYTA